tara:strand:+ start:91 stop:240 length:150 start_codon:yes stop_codon:yes gene_type:complete
VLVVQVVIQRIEVLQAQTLQVVLIQYFLQSHQQVVVLVVKEITHIQEQQ